MQEIITISEFRACYPDLSSCLTDEQISNGFSEVKAMYGIFSGFCPDQQKLAFKLATAHCLYYEANPINKGGQVKKISNKQDSVEYVTPRNFLFASEGVFGLGSTIYGSKLLRLLRYRYVGFLSNC